jgi:hypothetical protein
VSTAGGVPTKLTRDEFDAERARLAHGQDRSRGRGRAAPSGRSRTHQARN